MYSEGLLGGDHGLDTVVHVLNKVLLGATETSSVGDVVGGIDSLGVLSVDTADLHVVLVSDLLEGRHVLGELGESDVNGGTEGSSQVGGAGGDVTEMVVVGEGGDGLDVGSGAGEALEDGTDVSTLLHGDNSELILLVDPDKEGLVVVVEDTSVLGPVTVKTAGLEETVSLPEKDCKISNASHNKHSI